MTRFNKIMAIAAVGILALIGCNTAPQPEVSAPPSAAPSAPPGAPAGAVDAMKDKMGAAGFKGLNDTIANTKAAVEAGDFAKAQTEFSKFEGFWSKVEEGVKTKSAPTYEAIETAMGNIEGALKASDKAKALDALKALSEAVLTAGKPQ